jgi:hypothetical protein
MKPTQIICKNNTKMTKDKGTINEKINDVRIQKAKDGAERWNSFRLSITKPLTYKELTREARKAGLPYYVKVISFLHTHGNMIKSGEYMGANFKIYDKYLLSKEPIHYSVLLDIQIQSSMEAIENAKIREMNKTDNKSIVTETRPAGISIVRPIPVPTTQSEPGLISLSKIPDIKLVAELRFRGYEVTAKKIIEL